ncbi:hypothetical protein BKA62DRAFT_828294, partial [Auriculariales sp. MPI-PUGE-AT-0066]
MEQGDYNALLAILRPAMKTVPMLSSILEGSVEVVLSISAQVQAARKNKEDLEDLYKHAAAVQAQVLLYMHDQPGDGQAALLNSVNLFVNVLKEVKIFVVKTTSIEQSSTPKRFGHAVVRLFTATSTADKIAAMKERISDAAVVFGVAKDIRIEQRIIAINREILTAEEKANQQRAADRRRLLHKDLRPVQTAIHYSSTVAEPCTDGTRVSILQQMQDWASSTDGPMVYWLAGLAGTGKTTIASSFCQLLEAVGVKVLSFFITRHAADRNKLCAVVSTLAYQLAQINLSASTVISNAFDKQLDISSRPIAFQAQELLVAPLSAIFKSDAASTQQIVFVIDAMDECDDFSSADGYILFTALLPILRQRGSRVKLFVTSRTEPKLSAMIDRVFSGASDDCSTFLLHEVDEASVSADIRTFTQKGFSDIRRRFRHIPDDWPSPEQVEDLVTLSGKLFVFASTALLWIGEEHTSPISRLTEILSATRSSRPVDRHERSPYNHLDVLYLAALRNATLDPDPDSVANTRLRQILFLITCGTYDVCLDIISIALLLEHHEVQPFLDSLSVVVQTPVRTSTSQTLKVEPGEMVNVPKSMRIQTFHQSFSDFLVDPKRCTDERFRILREREEARVALSTLQAAQQRSNPIWIPGPRRIDSAHLERRWCCHLLNALRNPSLDCARVLSTIRKFEVTRGMSPAQSPYGNVTPEHLASIHFLLAVLVNQLSEPFFAEFQQDLIHLGSITQTDCNVVGVDYIALYAMTAIILHARFAQERKGSSETISQLKSL